ncbi:MAG TPA: hypothetical protein DCM18_06985 [Ruminococcus sp.]|nr:hypothetical protein [Ruminococcus sp.]HCW12599.1 hypothetical protein [Ruminococcus sp.]
MFDDTNLLLTEKYTLFRFCLFFLYCSCFSFFMQIFMHYTPLLIFHKKLLLLEKRTITVLDTLMKKC